MPAGATAVMVGMGVPAAIGIWGVVALGFGAISWTGAIVWGLVGTIAFTAVSMMGKAMGITNMDLLDLLGSVAAKPGSAEAKRLGLAIHLMNGALLGVGGAYAASLFGVQLSWASGLIWGVTLWGLALLMMSGIGAVHPAIRAGRQRDPGNAATNFGPMTPVGSLVGHVVFGVVLGGLYQTWPL